VDLIGYSKVGQEEQLQAAEKLNTAMEQALLAHGIRQLIGRLPTGDGAVLLIRPGNGVTHDAVLAFATKLLIDMHILKLFLRVGIHEGAVARATLGTSGCQNFCSSAMNLTQRIMDFADGTEREHNGQRKVMHAIVCSSGFVRNLASEKQKHFGKEICGQAKNGQLVEVRFYYDDLEDIPPKPKMRK
jgi:class 3 adenylate cyclase